MCYEANRAKLVWGPPVRLDGANAESRPACTPATRRIAGVHSWLDGAILGALSVKEPQRVVRKRLPMRSKA
jgi:hypothetical protein